MQISNAEELHKLLSKALQIEVEFESLAEWEGYVSVSSPKYRDLLFELISDSERHAGWVKEMLALVLLPSDYKAPSLPPATFDFRSKSELDTLIELQRYEQLALDLYSAIKAAVQRSDITGQLTEGGLEKMLVLLDKLIIDETHHRDAVHSYVGRVKMIR